jgi:transcriptional regulator with GAF, ATPase, and Fis domain
MSLPEQKLHRGEPLTTDRGEDALDCCRRAKALEDQGLYGEAAEELSEFWAGVGSRPRTAALDERAAAEVLLRAGALTGWLGSHARREGAQEAAKDLLSESYTRFERAGDRRKSAEALVELAHCYWRQGAAGEARATLDEADARLTDKDTELRALSALRRALVEESATRTNDALRILTEAAPLFEASAGDGLRGRYHNELAAVLWSLGRAERRSDYLDRAFIEYEAAAFYFERAGHTPYRAAVENNLGYLFLTVSKFEEAHRHLDSARRLFARLGDGARAAQVDETRARAMLASGRVAEAEAVARAAVRALEALTTHGVALARLGRRDEARAALGRARESAEVAGNDEAAGLAGLTLLEELFSELTPREVCDAYARADRLLARTQSQDALSRLRACAAAAVSAANTQAARERPAAESRGFVFASKQTGSLIATAVEYARAGGAVLVAGEPGAGKETLARLMHEERGGGEFKVFCADNFEAAAGATVFVPEVAELSQIDQARLLASVERADSGTLVVAATSRSLEEERAAGRLNDPLFYALEARRLELPPLRSRPEDIPALAEWFAARACARAGKRVHFPQDALAAMRRLPLLGGNADELRALVERTAERAEDGTTVCAAAVETLALRHDTGGADFTDPWAGFSFKDEVKRFEESLIERALHDARGRVSNAARLLGFRHHESLNWRLKNRNKGLLPARTPATRRRRSIIRKLD